MMNSAVDAFENLRLSIAKSEIKSSRSRLLLRLAVATRGGMTVADTLAALAEQEVKAGRISHAKVYKDIEAQIRSGEVALHQALADIVTTDERCFLVAEDKVSDVSILFQLAYDTANKKKLILTSITKPMILPIYLGLAAIAMLIAGGGVMLPNFAQMLPVDQWELPSQVVFHVGGFLKQHLLEFFLVVASSIGYVVWSLPNLSNSVRYKVLDKLFPWSLYKTLQSSSFILNLAALFKAKVSILDATNGYMDVSNAYTSGHLDNMRANLESEMTKTDMRALDVGFISPETMASLELLSNKLPIDEVVQKVGDAEFQMLAADVATSASRSASLLSGVVAILLVFVLYGSMSIIPTFSEKILSHSSQRK